MLILLPPSEGKTPPGKGPRLSLPDLGFDDLTPTRSRVIEALERLCRGPVQRARTTLGVSARMDDEIARNAQIRTRPCAPAGQVYTGVLYDALDWSTLTTAQRTRAGQRIAIASALFGLLRPTDHIPAYRLSADTNLPGLGRLRTIWAAVLPLEIAAAAPRGVIWDLRSQAYLTLGPVPAELADRTVVTRVFHQQGARRVAVSHHNKATKGRLARALLGGRAPSSASALAEALAGVGFRVELQPGLTEGSAWTLDVIVDQV